MRDPRPHPARTLEMIKDLDTNRKRLRKVLSEHQELHGVDLTKSLNEVVIKERQVILSALATTEMALDLTLSLLPGSYPDYQA